MYLVYSHEKLISKRHHGSVKDKRYKKEFYIHFICVYLSCFICIKVLYNDSICKRANCTIVDCRTRILCNPFNIYSMCIKHVGFFKKLKVLR